MTKLNKKRIKWLVDQVVKYQKSPKEIGNVYRVSERRVQQLVKYYRENNQYPELTTKRRPRTQLTSAQKQLIDESYQETFLSARLLYYELKRRKSYAPKNKIYEYLKSRGLVTNEPRKQKKRKRCRYEWSYTGDMVHADYHRTSEDHPHAIFWLDDRSRKILSGGEYSSPNAMNALTTFKQAQKELKKYEWTIQRVNTDRGSAFISNKNTGTSIFEQYCKEQGIQLIPSRVMNPQTNGKVERRWYEYDKHRWKFKTLQEWIKWHNKRLTTALNIEQYETPNDAFIRNLPNQLALLFGEKTHETKGQTK